MNNMNNSIKKKKKKSAIDDAIVVASQTAANEIRATLDLWTSPKLYDPTSSVEVLLQQQQQEQEHGATTTTTTTSRKSPRYHDTNNSVLLDDPNIFSEQYNDNDDDDDDDIYMDAVTTLPTTTISPPYSSSVANDRNRTTTLDATTTTTTPYHRRTNTPIISNSTGSGHRMKGSHYSMTNNHITNTNNSTTGITTTTTTTTPSSSKTASFVQYDEYYEVPYNIESPWVSGNAAAAAAGGGGDDDDNATGTPLEYNMTTSTNRSTKMTNTLQQQLQQQQPVVTTAMTTTNTIGITSTKNTMTLLPNRTTNTFCRSFQPYYIATERLWRHHQSKKKKNTYTSKTDDKSNNKNVTNNNNNDRQGDNSNMQLVVNKTNDMMIVDDHDTTVTTLVEQEDVDQINYEEMKIELDYIKTIQRYCWSNTSNIMTSFDNTTKSNSNNINDTENDVMVIEGNFWLLLSHLRQIGYATLLWDNDIASKQQYNRSIQVHIEHTIRYLDGGYNNNIIDEDCIRTPAAIIRKFYNNNKNMKNNKNGCITPLPIQRRKQILSWLQECFQNIIPSDITRIRKGTTKILQSVESDTELGKKMLECGCYRTNNDIEILHSSLCLLLSGRFLPDAIQLVREHEIFWRAVIWNGMIPHGYIIQDDKDEMNSDTIDVSNMETPPKLISVGNPNRAVWRRMMYHHSQELLHERQSSSSNKNDSELAIAALLSSNMSAALDCVQLRSWERGLYTIMYCMIERMEDDLLHRYNNCRRAVQEDGGPVYLGTEHELSELQHLQETSAIANIDEGDAITILDSAPFDEMRGDDIIHQATASFIIGKSAILAFIQKCADCITVLSDEEVRFVTHIAIYLDSLSYNTTTPIILSHIKQLKDVLVLQYIQIISSYEDLTYMIVLYMSFLPVDIILDNLPALLLNVVSMEERKVIVQQLRDFLPESNLDVEILRRVVALTLSECDIRMEEANNEDISPPLPPSRADLRKMESVLWFSIQNEHIGECLIAANTLLRKFFVEGQKKNSSAICFVDDVMKGFLSNCASSNVNGNDWLEYIAYSSYIDVIKAVQKWKVVIRVTHSTIGEESIENESIDKSNLNVMERTIAEKAERRKTIDIKRSTTRDVVAAAEAAIGALRQILEHPGGWLETSDEDLPSPNDVDALLRRKELDQIRNELFPYMVFSYCDTCTYTALWMSECLDDAAGALNMTANATIREIDESVSDVNTSVVASPITPRYWTQMALEIAEMTMNEKNNIISALRNSDYKLLLSKLSEISALDHMYCYTEQ